MKKLISEKELLIKIKNTKSISGIIRLIKHNSELLKFVNDRTDYLNDESNLFERIYNIKHEIFSIEETPLKLNE